MAKKGTFKVATCQFAVSGNPRRNGRQIKKQILQAKKRGAEVAHFSECALSGYPSVDMADWEGYDWDALREETADICQLARAKKLWVILGSSHPLTGKHKPHNCIYAINPEGRIVDRYDKCFCTRNDLNYFSPGSHFAVFDVNGVRCGMAICYDVRFPELYRGYRKRGVQCIFDSFHNARKKGPTVHTTIMHPSLQAHAATNYFWISVNNSSAHYQSWPGAFIQPDGIIVDKLKQHRAGMIVNTVDTTKKFYDASAPFRKRSMSGILHSGTLVRDQRSRARTIF